MLKTTVWTIVPFSEALPLSAFDQGAINNFTTSAGSADYGMIPNHVSDSVRHRMKSIFNSAIRRKALGYQGQTIWRET